jgi:hypothetical protein
VISQMAQRPRYIFIALALRTETMLDYGLYIKTVGLIFHGLEGEMI